MSRLANTIMEEGIAFRKNASAPMVDISQPESGQMGIMPQYEGYVSNALYIKRNLIAVLIEAPRGFRDLPNPEYWVRTLKNLIELRSRTIEGLQNTLTAEFSENPVGGGGQQQHDLTNVTRSPSAPAHTWPEAYGKAINAFFEGWITGLMMDPDTKIPAVMASSGNRPTDLLPDYTGATILYFEPDPTHTRVVQAWLCTNMMPRGAGDVTGRRDLTAAGEPTDVSVEFTSLTQHGAGVRAFAQAILDDMSLSGANPNLRPAFIDQITADVADAKTGYAEQLERASNTTLS